MKVGSVVRSVRTKMSKTSSGAEMFKQKSCKTKTKKSLVGRRNNLHRMNFSFSTPDVNLMTKYMTDSCGEELSSESGDQKQQQPQQGNADGASFVTAEIIKF